MIIRRIRIENFGHFHDFTLELVPGLNRLRHGNEFGKTTLLEFVRRVLWGFPDGRKTQLNRYPARFSAGEYGGSLEVEFSDGSAATLERHGVKGELVVRRADGNTSDGAEFMRKLTPVSEHCYRNVYAVTLDELEMLSALDGEEIRGRLYGGSITAGDVSLPALGKLLDNRCRELYKQRSGASAIRDAREDLKNAVDAHARTVARLARRAELEKERSALAEKSARLRKESDACGAAVIGTDLLLRAHPHFLKLLDIDRKLAALPPAPEVPESAAARAEALMERLTQMKLDLPPAPETARIESLAGELALIDREVGERSDGDVPLPDTAALADAVKLEYRAAELRAASSPARRVWFAVLSALSMLAAAAILSFTDYVLPAVSIAVAVFCLCLVRELSRRSARRRAVAGMEELRDEARRRWHLVCPPEEFVPTLKKRLRRETVAAELRRLRDDREAHTRTAETTRELKELCIGFGCADAAQMRDAARRTVEVSALRGRRAETAAALDALLTREKQSRLASFDPEAARKERETAAARLAEVKQELYLLHRQSGAVANELDHLPDGPAADLAASEVERARAALKELVREYLTVRGARELLDAAIRRYEKESQPEVIRGAEKLFSDFTGGRYTRLYKSVATGELLACDRESGLEKDFDALSRGTREELMLAMRLALIERIERDCETLPVVFDDVGVNFDRDRLAAVEKAVERFASARQVIWFSHS